MKEKFGPFDPVVWAQSRACTTKFHYWYQQDFLFIRLVQLTSLASKMADDNNTLPLNIILMYCPALKLNTSVVGIFSVIIAVLYILQIEINGADVWKSVQTSPKLYKKRLKKTLRAV